MTRADEIIGPFKAVAPSRPSNVKRSRTKRALFTRVAFGAQRADIQSIQYVRTVPTVSQRTT